MAKEYFADNARFADLCNNILYGGREAINLFAGTDIDIDEKEEVIDMCKAWEDQKNEGRE